MRRVLTDHVLLLRSMTNRRIALVVILFLGLVGGVTSAWLRAPSSPRASLRAPVVAPGNLGQAPGEPLPTTVQVGDEGADAGPVVEVVVRA